MDKRDRIAMIDELTREIAKREEWRQVPSAQKADVTIAMLREVEERAITRYRTETEFHLVVESYVAGVLNVVNRYLTQKEGGSNG